MRLSSDFWSCTFLEEEEVPWLHAVRYFFSVWNSIPNDARCSPSPSSFYVLFEDTLISFSLQRMSFLFWLLYICAWLVRIIAFLSAPRKNTLMLLKKMEFTAAFSLSAYFNAFVSNDCLFRHLGLVIIYAIFFVSMTWVDTLFISIIASHHA